VLARRNVERDGILSLEHHTISAGVDPAFLGILGNHQVVGADVATAVELMPARHRETFQVDTFFNAILEDRRVFDVYGVHRLKVSNFLPPRLDEFGNAECRIGAHRQRQSLDAVDLTAKHAGILARVGNVLEQ